MLFQVSIKTFSLTITVLLSCRASAQLPNPTNEKLCPELASSQRLQHASNAHLWSQTSMVLGNESHWREGALDAMPSTTGWHPCRVELDDLVPVKSIQPHRVEVVQHAKLVTTPALAKLAASRKDLASLAHENTVYRLLYDLGITPLFLGHVTVDGLIVGFLTEYVQHKEDGNATLSQPSSAKSEACLAALRKMHAKGIAHGDAHGENCLTRGDGSAVLIDFELAVETSDQAEFDRDLWIMTHTASD